ncbi:unnamed protein product [Allacma fusca]|uniref:Uncharacterized protein n=1 Tax=Allacma fusca TaxID=39272 RepID=A0A8J2JK47_9HEXA|nr:unnamed protein product [Allacma fusca]
MTLEITLPLVRQSPHDTEGGRRDEIMYFLKLISNMTEENLKEPFLLYEHLQEISNLAEQCLIPKLDNVEEEITEWENVISLNDLEINLDKVTTALSSPALTKSLEEHELTQREKALLVNLIVLVGEHRDPDKPWTSRELIKKCDLIVMEICTLLRKSSDTVDKDRPFDVAFGYDIQTAGTPRKTIFFLCLQNLRQKLRPSTWKYFPAAVASFAWIVTQVKYPNLSEFVGDLFAPSLLLLDDYNDENKILGIALAGHGMANLNKADITRDNWGLVLYNALHGLLYDKNPNMIDSLIPLLMSVLKAIEVNPNSNSHIFTKYDETMRKMLFALDTCSETSLKYSWIIQITSYLEFLGHATLHWNNKICGSIIHFTTTTDAALWKAMLNCLQVQVKNTWLKPNSNKIAEIVLRIVLNCSVLDLPNISPEERTEIIVLCRDTMKLLEYCSDFDEVRNELEVMKQNDKLHKKFTATLRTF